MCFSKNICAVLMRKQCNKRACYLVVQRCKKVNSSKNVRFRHEMTGETQPEMEVLEEVEFIYPLSAKAGS